VGATSHSLASVNDALFYFLADRPQATRFDMFGPGITTSAAVQSEIRWDLRQKQTEYVVLFRPPPSHEPNLSSADSGVRILDDAIRQDYIQVAEFGRYTIWHRKNLQSSSVMGEAGAGRVDGIQHRPIEPVTPVSKSTNRAWSSACARPGADSGSGRTGMETHVGSGEVDSNAAPEP
jgi:hypothetical protein